MSDGAGSAAWRRAEAERLLGFAAGAAIEGGFGWLADDGTLLTTDPRELWINARMTYVFSEAHRRGFPAVDDLARHGVGALLTDFRDPRPRRLVPHASATTDRSTTPSPATSTPSWSWRAARPRAPGSRAARICSRRPSRSTVATSGTTPRVAASRSGRATGRRVADYRGANSNMHTVEAYLAAGAVTRDDVWVDRAASIARAMVDVAEQHGWRLVEHFDAAWTPLPAYNRDRPRDPFRPFGATPGHAFEWARLLTEVYDATSARGPDPALISQRGGPRSTGRSRTPTAASDGFCYTTDWTGRPVVAERFHWVACEAILAADALRRAVPDDPRFATFYDAWWRFADQHFVDRERGSWWHELSPDLRPVGDDVAWQARRVPRVQRLRAGRSGRPVGSTHTTDGRIRVIELTRGQEMALETADGQPLTRLRMGLGWDKEPGAGFIVTGLPDVDLDATAVQFAGTQLFDIAFYNNLETRDGSVVHLGDNITGRGEGDDEQLTVDLGQVYPRVDTILFLVSSYQGHTLDWIDNAYCRLVDDQDVELARLTLTEGVPRTGLVMAKLFRDGEGWRLRAIGQGVAVTVPTESIDQLTRFL